MKEKGKEKIRIKRKKTKYKKSEFPKKKTRRKKISQKNVNKIRNKMTTKKKTI